MNEDTTPIMPASVEMQIEEGFNYYANVAPAVMYSYPTKPVAVPPPLPYRQSEEDREFLQVMREDARLLDL